jgi:hypothetical protein
MFQSFPALYATEDTPLAEKMLHVYYFLGSHDWYIAELDPETGLAFDYSTGGACERGYMDLVEMEEVIGAMSVIERDIHFVPTTTQELDSVWLLCRSRVAQPLATPEQRGLQRSCPALAAEVERPVDLRPRRPRRDQPPVQHHAQALTRVRERIRVLPSVCCCTDWLNWPCL